MCVFIKIGVFKLKSVFFIKTENQQQKSRPTARDGRRTGGQAVGFFVVYFCVFNENTQILIKNTPIFINTHLFLNAPDTGYWILDVGYWIPDTEY